MSKAKVNYLYNVILTLSGYIINLAVFPYVSRVLGVEMMGRFGFVNNMVEYFTVFSLMGIGIIGVREIASSREGSDLRRNYSSLIGLLSVQTAISLIVYVVAILTIPRFAHDRTLFAIGSIGLLSSSFLLEWFYQGMENFRFITVRSLAVKLAYVVSIFIFVRKPDDYGSIIQG